MVILQYPYNLFVSIIPFPIPSYTYPSPFLLTITFKILQ